MKKAFFLFLVILAGCTATMIQTQPLDEVANPAMSKDELYVQANLWMIDIFNDAKSVIQFNDKEAGVIKGRYVWYYQAASEYTPEYEYTATITIYTSDNNIKMTIQPEPYRSSINMGMTDMNSEFNEAMEAIKTSFHNRFD